MKKHLPKGKWTSERLASLPWRELAAIARYPWRGSKAGAKRRIHKLERAKAAKDLRDLS
jgi:hypothetical protein